MKPKRLYLSTDETHPLTPVCAGAETAVDVALLRHTDDYRLHRQTGTAGCGYLVTSALVYRLCGALTACRNGYQQIVRPRAGWRI